MTRMWGALLTGFGVGALAAANVGPIWLLCVRTSARYGWRPGAAIGVGAATVDLAYAVLGALGAAALLQFAPLRIGLGLLGAGVLMFLGARTLRDAFRRGSLVAIETPELDLRRQFQFVTHKRKYVTAGMREFIAQCRKMTAGVSRSDQIALPFIP